MTKLLLLSLSLPLMMMMGHPTRSCGQTETIPGHDDLHSWPLLWRDRKGGRIRSTTRSPTQLTWLIFFPNLFRRFAHCCCPVESSCCSLHRRGGAVTALRSRSRRSRRRSAVAILKVSALDNDDVVGVAALLGMNEFGLRRLRRRRGALFAERDKSFFQ